MAIAIRQNIAGRFNELPGSMVAATSLFVLTTSSSSLLVCIAAATAGLSLSAGITPVIGTPTTAGLTWTAGVAVTNATRFNDGFGEWWSIAESIYYVANAPSIGLITTTAVVTTSPAADDLLIGFKLLECTGVALSSPSDGTATATGQNSVPNAGTITTSAVDLIIASQTDFGSGGGASLGAGWTALNSGGVNQSFSEYKLNVAAGVYTAAFTGNVVSPWAACVIAFKPLAAAANTSGLCSPMLIGF